MLTRTTCLSTSIRNKRKKWNFALGGALGNGVTERAADTRAKPLITLLSCGVLTGLALATAAFPMAAVVGLAAKSAAKTLDELPAALTTAQAPQATEIYASDRRTLLARFADENRRDVPLSDVAPVMRDAIIAAEDRAFYRHNGVDPKAVIRAFVANSTGLHHQGASTLTMQYVRMSITYSASDPAAVIAASADTGGRKVREARMAVQLERILSKDEILERYLNMAPFGQRHLRHLRGQPVSTSAKHPRDLSLPEAAMIAGIVKSPAECDPFDWRPGPPASTLAPTQLGAPTNGAITGHDQR